MDTEQLLPLMQRIVDNLATKDEINLLIDYFETNHDIVALEYFVKYSLLDKLCKDIAGRASVVN